MSKNVIHSIFSSVPFFGQVFALIIYISPIIGNGQRLHCFVDDVILPLFGKLFVQFNVVYPLLRLFIIRVDRLQGHSITHASQSIYSIGAIVRKPGLSRNAPTG